MRSQTRAHFYFILSQDPNTNCHDSYPTSHENTFHSSLSLRLVSGLRISHKPSPYSLALRFALYALCLLNIHAIIPRFQLQGLTGNKIRRFCIKNIPV